MDQEGGMSDFEKAKKLIDEFKGDRYIHGSGVLPEVGRVTAPLGTRAALVCAVYPGSEALVEAVRSSLLEAGVDVVGEVAGAAPNAPREDLYRIQDSIAILDPDVIVCLAGEHNRCHEGGRGLADAGRLHRWLFRHRSGERQARRDRARPDPGCGHPDGIKLRCAPD